MRNILLLLDGAIHAALWTTAPLLLTSPILNWQRPFTPDDALVITGSLGNKQSNNAVYSDARGHNGLSMGILQLITTMSEKERVGYVASGTRAMVYVLLATLVGRALGCYVMDRNNGVYSRLNLVIRRMPCYNMMSSRSNNNHGMPSWRIACLAISAIIPLILMNWGLGIVSLGGWVAIRFITAFIAGGIMTWRKHNMVGRQDSNNCYSHKEKDELGDQQQRNMEEGQALLSSTFSDKESELESSQLQQKTPERILWLDLYWLGGVATSSFLGGFFFYPLNRIMAISHPNERLCAFIMAICLGGAVDRCLCRYYSKNRPFTTHSGNNNLSGASSSFSDAGIIRGDGEMQKRKSSSKRSSSSSSSTQRRKQVHKQSPQRQSTFDQFDEEQQITFYDHQMETPSKNRQRSNSNDTFESEQFFDCLDDIELDSEHSNNMTGTIDASTATAVQNPIQNYDNQIAIYSKRKVVYPDGSYAHVPAGECLSTIPPGYLTLYKSESKARTKYQQTQQWRRNERIYSIHARPHTWFPRIKVAYPHVLHGFTPNGMPVMYESPGKMNLKELFRNGCDVEDMIFHYCYLMEYLSNLESVLTEIYSSHADDDDCENDEWQDELAAYAHAKQQRLQTDSVSFGFCVVMDISGATPSSLSGDVMTYLKRAGEINSLHYPGSMRRAVAVQAPFWVGVAWKAIKGVMPASVTVDLLSGAQTMEGGLKEYIDEDQIPVEYGGKSRFRLGEHPFEVGLKKLVERQEEGDDDDDGDEDNHVSSWGLGESSSLVIPRSGADTTSLHDSTPLYFSPSPSLGKDLQLREDSPASSAEHSTMTREWDGIEHQTILTVTAILYFFVYVVVGWLELALPFWLTSPVPYGGLGYEPRKTGVAALATCVIISWSNRRSRCLRLMQCAIQKSPLRGFRIGIGTACFLLLCVSLIPVTSDPNNSILVLACFSAYFSLICYGTVLGIISLENLRGIVMSTLEEENGTQQKFKSTSTISAFGRTVGYIFAAPIYRWSVRKEMSFIFLCLLAGVCSLLYVLSFSLHTAAPSIPTNHSRRKESQFISAMAGWFAFAQEVLLVAYADVSFLVNEMSRKESARVYI